MNFRSSSTPELKLTSKPQLTGTRSKRLAGGAPYASRAICLEAPNLIRRADTRKPALESAGAAWKRRAPVRLTSIISTITPCLRDASKRHRPATIASNRPDVLPESDSRGDRSIRAARRAIPTAHRRPPASGRKGGSSTPEGPALFRHRVCISKRERRRDRVAQTIEQPSGLSRSPLHPRLQRIPERVRIGVLSGHESRLRVTSSMRSVRSKSFGTSPRSIASSSACSKRVGSNPSAARSVRVRAGIVTGTASNH